MRELDQKMNNTERTIQVFMLGLAISLPILALIAFAGLFTPNTLAHSLACFVFSVQQ